MKLILIPVVTFLFFFTFITKYDVPAGVGFTCANSCIGKQLELGFKSSPFPMWSLQMEYACLGYSSNQCDIPVIPYSWLHPVEQIGETWKILLPATLGACMISLILYVKKEKKP